MTITGADIINAAEKYSGVKYFEGNPQDTTHGFDCSGLVQRALSDLGVKTLPRTTTEQLLAANSGGPGKNIGTTLSQALQGDILHYTGHEEIWIGPVAGGPGKVFSESIPGEVAAVRDRTPWPIIGIVRYADSPGPPIGSIGQTTPGQAGGTLNSPQPPGAETDMGRVSGQLADLIPGVNTILGVLSTITKLFTFLLDPKNWWRVALSLFGVILLIIALLRLTKSSPVSTVIPSSVRKIANGTS